jgi:hypothetical protein
LRLQICKDFATLFFYRLRKERIGTMKQNDHTIDWEKVRALFAYNKNYIQLSEFAKVFLRISGLVLA